MTVFTDSVVFSSPDVAWQYDTSAIDPNAAKYNFSPRAFAGVNWNDPRANVVYALGYNVGPGSGRDSQTEPSIGLVFESYWVPVNGVPSMEAHLTSFDTHGGEHRILSAIVSRDGSGGVTSLRGDKINFFSYNNAQLFQMDAKGGVFSLNGGAHFLYGTNNAVTGQQINATRTAFLNLPYYDDQNRLRLGANWFDAGGNAKINGYVELQEVSEPAAPTGNLARLYCEDDGTGKTRLMVKFADGSKAQIAAQP